MSGFWGWLGGLVPLGRRYLGYAFLVNADVAFDLGPVKQSLRQRRFREIGASRAGARMEQRRCRDDHADDCERAPVAGGESADGEGQPPPDEGERPGQGCGPAPLQALRLRSLTAAAAPAGQRNEDYDKADGS